MSRASDARSGAAALLDWDQLELLILEAASQTAGVDGACGAARRAVVAGCLECWSYAVQRGEEWAQAPPVAVKSHAQLAARAGIELPALVRCYTSSRDLVWRAMCNQFAQMESEDLWPAVRTVWAAGESLLAGILDTVEAAHKEELELARQSPRQQQARLVRRLLRGDRSIDARLIGHDFDGRHLGLAAKGAAAARALSVLAELSGCRLYGLPEQDGTISAWLRVGRQIRPGDIERWLPAVRYPDLSLGIGRAAEGVRGFCETHRLAEEALRVAERRSIRIAWHADVALDALLLRDLELARSLIAAYIDPLEPALLEVLRAHSQAGWNESATARVLGVSRNYVRQKLKSAAVECGQRLPDHRVSFELALRAVELDLDRNLIP